MITKKATTKTKLKPQAETPRITTTETSKCPTLNLKNTVDYELGRDSDDKLHIRVLRASGGGHHSKEWISEAAVLTALGKVEPITAYPLRKLTTGRSVNTSGYLLAIVLAEGFIERVPGKARHYRYPLAKTSIADRTTTRTKPSPPAPAGHAKKPVKTSKK